MRLLTATIFAALISACAEAPNEAESAAPVVLPHTQARAAHALVEIGSQGIEILDVFWADEVSRSTPGEPVDYLDLLDDSGQVITQIPVPDSRLISVVSPDGDHGDSATLERTVVRVPFAWPDEAVTVRAAGIVHTPRTQIATIGAPTATQILGTGDASERLDLIFMGDGYTLSEQAKFEEDVDEMVAHMLTIEPYRSYAELFNVWRSFTPSTDSGADNSAATPPIDVNTAYDCAYNCNGTVRLLCCDAGKLIADASQAVPGYDGLVVLVNSATYGGAGGGAYASTYTDGTHAPRVMAHEMGHSLLGLWDEYSYGTENLTTQGGPNCAPDEEVARWSHWVGEDGVGAFTPCSNTNLHRPTSNGCMMNTLQDGYCPVCREHAVREIYAHLPGILTSTTPAEGPVDTTAGAVTLSATSPLGGLDSDLWTVSWKLDGVEVSTDPTYTVQACSPPGTLTLDVIDPTAFVREDPNDRLSDQASWQVGSACDLDSDGFTTVDDCDDSNDTIFPGAPETPNDSVDSDCDGFDGLGITIGGALVPGTQVTFTITDAAPRKKVYMLATIAGLGQGACPPQLNGDCMDVIQPAFFQGTANGQGVARITVTVPNMVGRQAWFQAAQLAAPAQKSNVATQVIGQ